MDKEHQNDKENSNALLNELHKQYAVNNNSQLSTIITFVVAVIAVFGYFGYIYINSGCFLSPRCGIFIHNGVYTLEALLLAYIASVCVLAIIASLCAYQGVTQRKEQFIIHAIREREFGYKLKYAKDIFPSTYKPFKKKGLKIIQGIYGELIKIFLFTYILLTIALLTKAICYMPHNAHCCYTAIYVLHTFLFVVLSIIILMLTCIYISYRIDDYKKIERTYKAKRRRKRNRNKREKEKKEETIQTN